MKRTTIEKPACEMNMVELAHNCMYARDRWAWYRDYDSDMDLRDFIRKFSEAEGASELPEDNEALSDILMDDLQYGINDPNGRTALVYRLMWAMADLRETLMEFENMEEQKRIIKLPCKVGDIVWGIFAGGVSECFCTGWKYNGGNLYMVCMDRENHQNYSYFDFLFGEKWFLKKEEAEKELDKQKTIDAQSRCKPAKTYGNPGMEEGTCAGIWTEGSGEPCDTCKRCRKLYCYE